MSLNRRLKAVCGDPSGIRTRVGMRETGRARPKSSVSLGTVLAPAVSDREQGSNLSAIHSERETAREFGSADRLQTVSTAQFR